MKKLAVLSSVAALISVFAGCSSDAASSDGGRVEEAKSSLTRDLAPSLTDAEQASLATGQADFAVDLYRTTANANAGETVFLSPHSASIALGMAYAGARGTTASEMRTALHLALPDERVHAGFDYLDLQLASRGQGAVAKDGKPFRLNIANGLFGQKGAPFESSFLDTLAVNYGAGVSVVDYQANSEGARKTINGWVESKTEDRIKDLMQPGSVSPDTRLVLVNAVYFNASWQSKFKAEDTYAAPFTKLDGAKSEAQMMHQRGSYAYAKGDGYQAIAMPYDGGELAMLAIVPDAGTFAAFESGLTGAKVLQIASGLASTEVQLGYPKHHFEGMFELTGTLKTMGMNAAFDGTADFSGILKTEHLVISQVIQQTFLDVDEAGTEAAAATAIGFEATSAPAPAAVQLEIDRPYLEAIYDTKTKSLVFLGRIVEPKTK